MTTQLSMTRVLVGLLLGLGGSAIQEARGEDVDKPFCALTLEDLLLFGQKIDDQKYLLVPPKDYQEGTRAVFPLLVALHGFGGDAEHLMWGIWQPLAREQGYFVAVPQLTHAGPLVSEERFVLRMLEEIERTFPIDKTRIFLTGDSAGAHLAFYLALKNPGRFKAVAAIAGMIRDWAKPYLASAKGMRILMIQGTRDDVNTMSESLEAKQLLERHGAEVTYRLIEGLDHTYPVKENEAILEWLEEIP